MINHFILGEVTPSTTLGTMIVVSGSFLLLLLLIKKFAWEAISEMLKKREEKIANDLDSAEKSRISAAKLEEERQQKLLVSKTEAADIIKNAKETGNQSRQKIIAETNDEIVSLKEKAHQDIAQKHDEALAEIKNEVAALSLQIAEKILNKELTAEAHETLINSYIDGLGKSNEA